MKITVDVEGKTAAEIGKNLSAIAAAFAGTVAAQTTAPAATAPKKTKPKAEEAEEFEMEGNDEGAEAEEPTETEEAEEPEEEAITLKDVKKSLEALAKATGSVDEGRKLLVKHGGVKLSKDLDEDKYAAVIKAVNAATKKAA